MKKLILSAAIILGSLTTMSAQDQNTNPTEAATEATTTTGYSEIKLEQVPAAVIESLMKLHPEAIISKAFANEKNEYKLNIKSGNTEETLFADANGQWIQS
ncbi:hypothetical protein [Flavobacterium sp. 7A]|uniref:hypothetical protein n=1 Tax=Flavobacterium sp. 7A TaxID=2940571 RepID=UPI0022264D53|nr:hypothetical protein [Flavobacterium sp. 7A]MCW2121172.1 hypothetical protein [Flavobacterium sp. 7A]